MFENVFKRYIVKGNAKVEHLTNIFTSYVTKNCILCALTCHLNSSKCMTKGCNQFVNSVAQILVGISFSILAQVGVR